MEKMELCNLEYFRISIENEEKLDTRYMSLEKHNQVDAMIKTTKKIKDLLVKINESGRDKKAAYEDYEKLRQLVLSDKGNKNEFNSFINACDSTVSTIKEHPETFYDIVDLYLEYRDIAEETPRVWIQAMIDKGSQRSLGKIGERKVVEIAQELGFQLAETTKEFFQNKYSVAYYTDDIKNSIDEKLDFGSQDKKLDVIFNLKNKGYAFLEAKHIKSAGGAQDKQINELIGLLDVDLPKDKNIFIISFMDGVYSNRLLNITEANIKNPDTLCQGKKIKIKTQQKEIIEKLFKKERIGKVFWVNTRG